MSIGNEPAYPREHYWHSIGLTKRELFAAMAMQGYITRINGADLRAVAFDSVRAADALLAALSKEPGHEGG